MTDTKWYGACFADGASILSGEQATWAALLVRDGKVSGSIDGCAVELQAGQCCCLAAGSQTALRACGACDCAIVIGQSC